MTPLEKYGPRIRNIIHALASVSFTIWLIGFFGYNLGGWFFTFLGFALITAFLLLRKVKPRVNGGAK